MQQSLDLKFNPFHSYGLLLKVALDYWVRQSYMLETEGFDLAFHTESIQEPKLQIILRDQDAGAVCFSSDATAKVLLNKALGGNTLAASSFILFLSSQLSKSLPTVNSQKARIENSELDFFTAARMTLKI